MHSDHRPEDKNPPRPVWVGERTKPKAKAAKVGSEATILRCKAGDVIEIRAKSGRWYAASVAWLWPDGHAMLRMGAGTARSSMKVVPPTATIRWVKVRP